jgi:hypothetical protein
MEPQGRPVLQGRPARRVPVSVIQARPDLPARRVRLAIPDRLGAATPGPRVRLARLAPAVATRALPVPRARLEAQERMAALDLPALQERLDRLVPRGVPVLPVRRVLRAAMELQDPRGPLGRRVRPALQARLGLREVPERTAPWVRLALLAQRERRARQVPLELLEGWDPQDLQEALERQDQLDLQPHFCIR